MTKVASNPAKMASQVATNEPPERIHNWLNTQFSIALFSGGITYNSHHYTIAYDEPEQPLVRYAVLQRENKAAKGKRAESKQRAADTQGDLI